jgi:hypothetical protein
MDLLFSGLAYQNIEKKESYFHSMFYLIARLLGYNTFCEVPTSDGRIDALIQAGEYLYVIEFKLGTANEAIAQLQEMQYHLPFVGTYKHIHLLGIGFDAEAKKVSGWKEEVLANT